MLARVEVDSESIKATLINHTLLNIRSVIATFFVDFYPHKIKPGDWLFDAMADYADALASYGYSVISYRNPIMAQRASALAQYHIDRGVKRPLIIVTTGSLHIGATRDLQISTGDRWQKIRLDSSHQEYTKTSHISRIQSTQFNQNRGTWTRRTINDPTLPAKK